MTAAGLASFAASGPVGSVVLANPPVNPLGSDLLTAFDECLSEAADAGVKVVVVSSAVDGFFAAGADIKLMTDLDRAGFEAYHRHMRATLATLDAAPFLSIAAIEGQALGGGLELAPDELAAGSQPALRAVVRCVDAAHDLPLAEGLEVETAEEMALFDHGEAREGLRAFLERRPPDFA